MSEKEKQAVKELLDSMNAVPVDGQDFVRGYLKGRIDGLKIEKEEVKNHDSD